MHTLPCVHTRTLYLSHTHTHAERDEAHAHAESLQERGIAEGRELEEPLWREKLMLNLFGEMRAVLLAAHDAR